MKITSVVVGLIWLIPRSVLKQNQPMLTNRNCSPEAEQESRTIFLTFLAYTSDGTHASKVPVGIIDEAHECRWS